MSVELSPKHLKESYDSKKFNCKTTAELSPLEGIIGQDRAVKALKFGLNIDDGGFNIFVTGYTGTGRTTSVREFVQEIALTKHAGSDWCYVNNFKDSYEPAVVRLPAGRGKTFQQDIKDFIAASKNNLSKAFESKDYSDKKDVVARDIEQEKEKLLNDLNLRARDEGFALRTTQIGLYIVPVIDGKILEEQDFLKLNEKQRQEIQDKREKVNMDLKKTMDIVRDLDRKIEAGIKQLNQDVVLFTIEKHLNEIRNKYNDIVQAIGFIDEVKADILGNFQLFVTGPMADASSQAVFPWMKEIPFKKYEVNLIVDNSGAGGAPVVIETNPTYQNLFGRIEKEAQFGVLTTDLTMIRGGSLHKANDGFIVIPAEEMLKNFFSWDSLKNSLVNKRITIEEAGEKLGYITTKGLKPEPIPLNVKVILIGNPTTYGLLYSLDEDFKKLFKVRADFDLVMDRNEENVKKYLSFICAICNKENMNHLEAEAAAKVMEYGSRLAEDKYKISTRFSEITDIIAEANFYSEQEKSKYIKASHINKAVEEKIYRSNLIDEKIKEYIADGTILIDTVGSKVGQVNGLSVTSLGDYAFGKPSRLTVTVGMGRDGIIDIEREAKLGGPIHSKGVLILGGFIADRYSKDKPLSLSARIVFEQSYGGIEGDSASSAELYAILSALSGLPLRQDLAVTGSVNQKGQVQAIGGVNEKIEGFYEICKIRGLTGSQGVIIPASNIKNLMLKDEIIYSVSKKHFHIYTVRTIDEGIELLTGVKAGGLKSDGTFPKNSVNHMVDSKISFYAKSFKDIIEKPEIKKKNNDLQPKISKTL